MTFAEEVANTSMKVGLGLTEENTRLKGQIVELKSDRAIDEKELIQLRSQVTKYFICHEAIKALAHALSWMEVK
jgi:hypothetical protein